MAETTPLLGVLDKRVGDRVCAQGGGVLHALASLPTELGACVTDVATCLFEDPSCVDLACDLCNHLGESSTHVALRAG